MVEGKLESMDVVASKDGFGWDSCVSTNSMKF